MARRTRVSPLLAASLRGALAALMVASLTVACSKRDAASGDSASADANGGTVDVSSALSDAPKGKVHLEVTGGPHAGTYDAEMKDGGCSYGLAGEGAWGNQYSIDTKDAKQFSSLQLIVPNTKAAAGGSSTFQLTAGFGPLFGDGAATYDVNTTSNGRKQGSGKVTVDDKGNTGKVSFDAKTGDGVGLKGTIDCSSVMRAG